MNSFLPKFRKWELEHPIAAAFVVMLLFSFFRKGLYLIFIQLPNTKGLWFLHQFLDLLWPVGMVMLFGLTSIYRKGDFLDTLLAGKTLEPRHRDHPLSGVMKDYRECHILPD